MDEARVEGLLDQLKALHDDAATWSLLCCHYDKSLAEDVLQSTYLKILEERARFGGASTLGTWLLGVIPRTKRCANAALWLQTPASTAGHWTAKTMRPESKTTTQRRWILMCNAPPSVPRWTA